MKISHKMKLPALGLLVIALAGCQKAAEPETSAQTASTPVHVAASAAAAKTPAELQAPIAEYKQYVSGEVAVLVKETQRFAAAIKAGKLKQAQALYAPTRQHYERIEPIAELFSDLDNAIDVREDDFKEKAADPRFTGFHRLEKALFGEKSTKDLSGLSDKLVADTQELQKRIQTLNVPPAKMVGGAAALIEEVAATKISGEEDRYSHTDLWDFQANVDGAQVDSMLAKYRLAGGKGFVDYGKLTAADRTAMKGPITALAEDLSKLRGVLGLD